MLRHPALRRHALTFLSALPAGIRAFAAMLHVLRMFGALLGTGAAGNRAVLAHLFRILAAHAHKLRGSIAKHGAFHVKLDAARHHFYIVLFEAGCGAMVADSGTTQAGIYALLVLVVTHSGWFLW